MYSERNMNPTAVFVFYMFFGTVHTVSGPGLAGCRESYFLSNGECLPCPNHCVSCSSNTNCTKCTYNHYGVMCQHKCPQQDCECHKIYEYCTYGCSDGYFAEKDSPQCSPCPDNCDLCSSSSTCVLCKPRFYGDTCAQQCSTNCETCNKKTGKCVVCEEGYFNQDGQCLRCPERCVGCFDNIKCSGCKANYVELGNGQCIKRCEMNSSGTFPPLNKQSKSTEKVCDCAKDLTGQSVMINTRQPCINDVLCPSTVPCPACGAIMTYQCNHTCRLKKERQCLCESECIVVEETKYGLTFCMNTKGSVSVNVPTTLGCIPVAENMTHDDTRYGSGFAVYGLVIVSIVILTMMAEVLIISIRKSKRKLLVAIDSLEDLKDQEEGECFKKQYDDLKCISDTPKTLQQATVDIPKIDKSCTLSLTSDSIDECN